MERKVAPFAGAWIEMFGFCRRRWGRVVAPFAGAWIEIVGENWINLVQLVAPFAGAWIEIASITRITAAFLSRSLRGSVD